MAITPAEAMAGMELTDEEVKKVIAGMELTDEEMKKVMASPVPHDCPCPITRQIMLDPVVAADGHSYERTAIQKWFDTGNTKSPMTSEVLLA
jgi:hypothetical protein